jgi:hypothetical protein
MGRRTYRESPHKESHHVSAPPDSMIELLEAVVRIAKRAGRVVLDVYEGGCTVTGKSDGSPVTEADHLAEALILSELRALSPDVPVVAEEAVAAGNVPRVGDRFWLVDPLDGTKEFVSRNGEFTVNIALVEQGGPVLGVVFAPALGRLFAGAAGHGAFVEDAQGRRPIRCRAVPAGGCTVVASRSHGRRCGAGRVSRRTGRRVADRGGLFAEAVPGGGRRSRLVPPARAHHGVGRRGGPRGPASSRRQSAMPVRRRTSLWQAGFCEPAVRRQQSLTRVYIRPQGKSHILENDAGGRPDGRSL